MRRFIPLMTSLLFLPGSFSCSDGEIRPVDIYDEDVCSFCKMAISEKRFAGEVIGAGREVFKFDDIGCMAHFRQERLQGGALAEFVMDYDRRTWIPLERAVLVRTGLMTPMGSGLVAFGDSVRAMACVKQYPPGDLK